MIEARKKKSPPAKTGGDFAFNYSSRHVCDFAGWRASIHVFTAVHVVVDLGGTADHSTYQERRETCRFYILFLDTPGLIFFPDRFQKNDGDHGVDVDAVYILADFSFAQRFNKVMIKFEEHVVQAIFLK